MQTLTAPPPARASVQTKRITSIDFLRGLVMVIMALDHVRDYFHSGAMIDSPTNLETTTPILFFTRWITHFCAPVFVFLAGTSAFLSGQKKTKKELSFFLFTRGLWLVLAEAVLVGFGWSFDPLLHTIALQVIWAIGASMMVLSALVWLPFQTLLLIGVAIVFGHNLLDPVEAATKEEGLVWHLLHTPDGGYYQPYAGERGVFILYAFPVWLGIMILGYCFGSLYRRTIESNKRKKYLLRISLVAISLFVVLRFFNVYGDPSPWSQQKTAMLSVLSFFNVSKYPPSLLYTLMTIGPAILFLAFFEHLQGRFSKYFIVFGRVPFFYYILHIYLIHVLCAIAFFASGYGINDLSADPFYFRPQKFGFELWAVYLIWITVVLLLYPLCRWYNKVKSASNHWAFSYL